MREGFRVYWRLSHSTRTRRRLQEFVTGLASRALSILELPERKAFLEKEIERSFGFRRVEILIRPEGHERFSSESTRVRSLLARVLGILDGLGLPFLNRAVGKERGVAAILGQIDGTYCFAVKQSQKSLGLLVIDTSPMTQLDADLEKVLLSLCDQLAVVLENSNLLRGKLELERTVSQQAQMVQLGEMTARIAHEIKNPLSSIKTIVQLMQEDPEMGAKYSKDLALVNAELDRLGHSVAQLLNFARPSGERQEGAHLREVAASVVSFLERDLKTQGSSVSNEIPADLPHVAGNAYLFREVFLNLILNALQAGGAGMQIWLRAWEGVVEDGAERFVLLVVEDNGPGIAPTLQSKIFMPFFTTKQLGTGLGLTIVRRDIEHLGGRITVESPARQERGTRFLMHLPLFDSNDK